MTNIFFLFIGSARAGFHNQNKTMKQTIDLAQIMNLKPDLNENANFESNIFQRVLNKGH